MTVTGPAAPSTTEPSAASTAQRTRAFVLVAGGLLFALGNALHPLEHSDAATHAPTWAAAHLIFALGALLVAGGLPALAGRVGRAGLVLTAVGMVFVVGSAYVEVYVAPVVGHATMERIEDGAAAWGLATLVTFVLGPVLLAAAGLWRRTLPVAACVGIVVAQVAMAVGPALPVAEGVTIIPASVLLGLSLAGCGASRM